MNTGLRTRLLTLLAAPALLLSTQVNAGSIFGPATFDAETTDLSVLGAKFPKRDKESKEGEILVKFKAAVPTSTRDATHVQKGNLKLRELKRSAIHQVRVSPDQTLDGAIASYRSRPQRRVRRSEFCRAGPMLTPNEPAFNLLWGMNNTGQTRGTPDADIKAPQAWDLSTGSATVVVMVIDTGVDYTHPDLAANIWINPGEIAGNGVDDDGNGYVDDVHGIDFVNGDARPDGRLRSRHPRRRHHRRGRQQRPGRGRASTGTSSIMRLQDSWTRPATAPIADAVTCLEYARDLKTR